MDSRFEDVDRVPDPSAYESLETRNLDYDGIQDGEPVGAGGFARATILTVGRAALVVKEAVTDGAVTGDTIDGFVDEERPDFIQSGDTTEVVFTPQKRLSVEPVSEMTELGALTIWGMGQTVGVGGLLAVTGGTHE